MKNFVIVAAAAVVAGLLVYAFLEWRGWLLLSAGGVVMARIPVFVGVIATVGILSATLALVMQAEIRRAERRRLRELERRIGRLEEGEPMTRPERSERESA